MPEKTQFLPIPRQITTDSSTVTLPDSALIVVPDDTLLFEAQTAQAALEQFAGLHWPVVAGHHYASAGLTLTTWHSRRR